MYFVVKVTSGQERIAANMLQNKMTPEIPVYSIIVVEGMRGYIIVEAEDEVAVRQYITKGRNIRGILPKPLAEDEVNKLIEVRSHAVEIQRGDSIEFTSGPFKGYKAKVLKVDELKDDITVELMDVVVPIPITTKMNTAKVIQKADKA
ncbi:MAG TPA: transcription elongation factor Spt5 [Candidatus Acidoferrales bacterium]|nr:transcription elongation factor Spt5 [Candidatus Acidoferrales bacterium]